MVSVKGGWMPSGSYRLEPTGERKRARPGNTGSAGSETKMRRRIVRERENNVAREGSGLEHSQSSD